MQVIQVLRIGIRTMLRLIRIGISTHVFYLSIYKVKKKNDSVMMTAERSEKYIKPNKTLVGLNH